MSAGRPSLRGVVRVRHRAGLADLHDELAVAGELENLPVLGIVAADPDEVVVVDEDAVLVLLPVVALAGAAPGLHDLAVLVELDHRAAPARST